MKEITESRERRKGSEQPLTHTEQMELKETTHEEWGKNGYVLHPNL